MIFIGVALIIICCIYSAFVFNWVKLNKVVGEIFGDSEGVFNTSMQNAITPKVLSSLQGPLSLLPIITLIIPCILWYFIIGWWCILLFFLQYLLLLGIISGILSAVISVKNLVMISLQEFYNRLADYTRDKDGMRVEAANFVIKLLETFLSFVEENEKEGYKITLFRLEKLKPELKQEFEEMLQD